MSYIGNQPTSAAFLTDTFSGNASTTAFTMSVAPANTSSMLVAITGVVQDPSTYSVAGTTLTFSAAPPTGTNNISVRYLGIPASGVTTTAYRTVTNFTATAGQTSFTVPSYTVGYIDVYRNGVRLTSADFTASTGTTVVLANAANAGDSVVTESFYVSSVLNAIPATAGSVGTTYITDASVTQAKLGTNVAGNGPAFSAYLSGSNQSLAAINTFYKVTLNAEEFDTNSYFDSTTNYRFQPLIAGYYLISAQTYFNGTVVNPAIAWTSLFKNGSEFKTSAIYGAGNTNGGAPATAVIYLNGSSDYVEMYVKYTVAGSGVVINNGSSATYMTGSLIRAA